MDKTPETLCEEAVALEGVGDLDGALSRYADALRVNPNLGVAHFRRGLIFLEQAAYEAAIVAFDAALTIKPESAGAYYNRGMAYLKRAEHERAIQDFQRALSFNPALPEAHMALGVSLEALGQFEAAITAYDEALALMPENAEYHFNRAGLLNKVGETSRAILAYEEAIRHDPHLTHARSSLSVAYMLQGAFEKAEAFFQDALQTNADDLDVYDDLLFSGNYVGTINPMLLFELAKRYGVLASKKASAYQTWSNVRDPQKRLRVGWVSGDLCAHPVGYFIQNIMRALHLDFGEKIESYVYATHFVEDTVTQDIKKTTACWRRVVGMTEAALASKIYEDRIDILIDLSGHTGHNRLPVFAWRPAPVQVSWLGYFATTGIAEIDYLIADPWTLPPSEEEYFTETIWRLPETRLCFTPPADVVPVSPLPALSTGGVTFGSFNNLSKINDEVVALWAQILLNVRDSQLFFKAKPLQDKAVSENLIARFEAQGVASGRLIFEGHSAREAYFRAYHHVDISLDPFPYPGGTTTVESLWMGVPVLTLAGERFLSRQGVGLLMNAGLEQWVAADKASYLEKAIFFANHLPELALLRSRLREEVLASPIVDAPRFAHHFEGALREMWRRWCAGEGIGKGAKA